MRMTTVAVFDTHRLLYYKVSFVTIINNDQTHLIFIFQVIQ